ncbi:hypothetical protein PV325_000060 [Microctonus aethiopoides]|nr:hypothetical protein PV325_000060 [Microctonus aethiopoides]
MGKTRGVHETTPELRNRMVGMYEAGLGLREIAAAVNCSQRTVKRWLNRFDKEGTVETRDRCGRKRATTVEEDEAIVRLATQTPITAAKAVLPALGLNCSVDTIRERLHKAGIHNWSPSRKHIQRIPLGDADGAAIQQAVWRPTGTQLGKKKNQKGGNKSKKSGAVLKKKVSTRKAKSKNVYEDDGAPQETSKQQQDELPQNQTFAFQQNIPEQQSQTQHHQSQNVELQTQHQPAQSLIDDQPEYNNSLGLSLPGHPMYPQHPHSAINLRQSWPLDLVQNSHHYSPSQSNPMAHDQPPPQQHLQELHTQREQEQHVQQAQQHAQEQHMQEHHSQQSMQHPLHHHHHPHHHHHHHHHHHNPLEIDQMQHQMEQVQQTQIQQPHDPPENLETGKIMRSSSCSNSCSSNDNSMSDDDNELIKDDSRQSDDESDKRKSKTKKKGGKAKGTLETSVEIRNRMIGMAEAGLSTLSIALAINRSERTVKRWLERWNKEGNVQTKERKGRRRITTKEQDDAIIAMATQHPLTAAKHVAPALGLNCSVDTIRERLHKAGIHSWKLGKKQGEGNAVHTVHLWQPSGNRPNKPKLHSEKKKRSSRSGKKSTASTVKRITRKKKTDNETEQQQKIVPPSASIVPEPNPIQYHDPGALTNYPPDPNIMQPVHISVAPLTLPPPTVNQCPPGPQPMQTIGPIIQQRPDCRMVPPVSSQGNPGVSYSSCMVGNNSHMEQTDPLNYEPFIWTF